MRAQCHSIASGWCMADSTSSLTLNSESNNQIKKRTGAINEQGTTVGWDKKGRVHSDFGWQAAKLGGQRPAFCRMGNLPRERLSGGAGSALRFAKQRLVWPNHSTLE